MILFVDACIREKSRTRELAQELINELHDYFIHIKLYDEDIPQMSPSLMAELISSSKSGYDHPYFDTAKQFANADKIVIAAPFWDFSFPAILRKYLEAVCVLGLTFKYSDNGVPTGMCKATEAYYVTTAGGKIHNDAFSYGYIKALFADLLGIKKTTFIKAEGLDIKGADVDKIMDEAKAEIHELFHPSKAEEACLEVQLYTDGACSGNPGPGGWGSILRFGDKEKELSGGESDTTNNRMELTAVIKGLEALKKPCTVQVYTDSSYVCNGINKGWAKGWRKNGWVKSDKKPALNSDLWARLLDLTDVHNVTFNWIKGHAGHPENERCDEMAVAQSQKYK